MNTRKTRLALIAFATMTFASSAQAQCAAGWTGFGGHCYAWTFATGYFAGEADAATHGGHLVAVNSFAENDFLKTNFLFTHGEFYIGASDMLTEGTFLWSNGDPFTFTRWNSGEPNNSGAGEDFAYEFFDGMQGIWNDTVENRGVGGVMEVDPSQQSVAPEPASLVLLGSGLLAVACVRRRRLRHNA